MRTKALEIALTFSVLSAFKPLAQSCDANKFVQTEGAELQNAVFKTIQKSLVELCWAECSQFRQWCKSLNVRKVFEIFYECDLNNAKKSEAAGLVRRADSDYFEMEDLDPSMCAKIQCKGVEGATTSSADSSATTSTSTTTTTTTTTAITPLITTASTSSTSSTGTSSSSSSSTPTNNALLTQPATTSPASNSACQLDFPRTHSDEYVKVTSPFSQTISAFTVSFWLKVPSSYDKQLRIFSYDSSTFLEIAASNGETELSVDGGAKAQSGFRNDNTWQNIVVIWARSIAGGEFKIYRNGLFKGSETGVTNAIGSSGTLYLGRKHPVEGLDPTFTIVGSIADFQMWSNVVNAGTIYGYNCESTQGDVLSWQTILQSTLSGVTKTCPSTCMP